MKSETLFIFTPMVTTGNNELDQFMQQYLAFMHNLSERIDTLYVSFAELAASISERVPGAMCSCSGNTINYED